MGGLPGEQPASTPADTPPMSIRRMLRLRFTIFSERRSTEHGRGDDYGDAEDDGAGDDRGGDVAMLDDFPGEMTGCKPVEQFESDNGGGDANDGEEQDVADGLEQRLRAPGGRGDGVVRRQ